MAEQAAIIYNILLPMKRKPEMSTQEFRDYYDNHHAPLAAKSSSALWPYVRTYLEPILIRRPSPRPSHIRRDYRVVV